LNELKQIREKRKSSVKEELKKERTKAQKAKSL